MGSYSQRPIIILFAICVVIFCAMLASCVSFDKTYYNDKGGEFRCQSSGMGIGGTIHADAARQSCEAKALAAGYK